MQGRARPATMALGDWLRIYDEKYLKPLAIVQMYLFTTGTWQYWDMFAPNPADTDQYGDAVIQYKDGTVRVGQYPRMYALDLPHKYVMERYRKFYERTNNPDQYPFMYLPFLYREALENYNDPNNPPVKVELRLYKKTVAPIGTPSPQQYTRKTWFVGEIDPKILNQLAAEGK